MPEGDTLFRIARVLDKALGRKVIRRFRSPLPTLSNAKLEGHTVSRVESLGKNLLIYFDDGRALLSHLRMHGSWHIYRPGERWQKPEYMARAVLETDDMLAVCFSAPVVELLRPGGVARHPVLSHLGPDVLKDDFDAVEARRRLKEIGEMEIGAALLEQSALSGIGNIYKSEVLFLCRRNPFAKVRDLSDGDIDTLVAKARELMSRNLEGKPRTTRVSLGGSRIWVYKRSGAPCFVCRAVIKMRRQGVSGRSTYFCPVCQGVAEKSEGP